MLSVDDIWLASFLISSGAELSSISVFPSGNRLTAVFELQQVPDAALAAYRCGSPQIDVHALRSALNHLRDLMHCELQKQNGKHSVKAMPNGNEQQQRRCERNESRAIRNR
jgi:hypothetical protein